MTMSRHTVRYIFIFALIVLPVQYGLVGIIGHSHSEPWPTLVLPAFQSVGDQDGPISVNQITLEATFNDGERTSIPVEAFLSDLPPSQHLGFFRSQCQPASLSGTTRTKRCLDADAATWARNRVASLHPDRSPRRLDVVWNRLTYTPPHAADGNDSPMHRTPLDTLSIRW